MILDLQSRRCLNVIIVIIIISTNTKKTLEVLSLLRQRLRCFIHRLISPMHRTDVCIDASNFQPMNGIKQHLGESIIRRVLLLTIFLIKFNFQQRNFITLNRSTDEFNNSLVQV